jgi:type II secretory pathway pseudopilin PulG
MNRSKQHNGASCEAGFLIIEMLVMATLFAIIGLSLATMNINSIALRGKTHLQTLSAQLAAEALEIYAGTSPANLDYADDLSLTVTLEGFDFTKTVDVTVNADGSRTVAIQVQSLNVQHVARTDLTVNYPLWGNL